MYSIVHVYSVRDYAVLISKNTVKSAGTKYGQVQNFKIIKSCQKTIRNVGIEVNSTSCVTVIIVLRSLVYVYG